MVDTGVEPSLGDVIGNELGIGGMFPNQKKIHRYRHSLDLRSVDERAAQVQTFLKHPGVDPTITDPRFKRYIGPQARGPDGSVYPFPRTPQDSVLYNLNHHMTNTILDFHGDHTVQNSHYVKLDETGGLYHDKLHRPLPGGKLHEPSAPIHHFQPHLGVNPFPR